jgi:glycolate oxidase FAD binding subunit
VIRIAFWAGALAPVLGAVDAAAAAAGLDPLVGGSAAAGVIHVAVDEGAPAAAVARFVRDLRAALAGPAAAPAVAAAEFAGAGGPAPSWASAVVLHAPAPVRASVDLWGPVPALGLMRAVKDQFDPGHRMAPGRFAGGI